MLRYILYNIKSVKENKTMKKNPILTIILCALALVFVVSCASTKDTSSAMKAKEDVASAIKSNSIDVNPEKSSIVDWSGRTAGEEAIPVWLNHLMRGNADVFKTDFGIDNSYIVKMSFAEGPTKDVANIRSKLDYNAQRSEELKTAVRSTAGTELNNAGVFDGDNAERTMATPINDISGHELVIQFWHKKITQNEDTGLNETSFISYSVYKVPKEIWLDTVKAYMKSVIPTLPDSESRASVAANIKEVYEHTTSSTLKSETEVLAEVNAKQEAIRNSEPGTNPNDLEWLNVLETACNIIF